MKNIEEKSINHFDDILKEIEGHFSIEEKDVIYFDLGYDLYLLELLRTYSNISRSDLERTLVGMKRKNKVFNYREFIKENKIQLKNLSLKNRDYKFYFLLNHFMDKDIILNSFKISRLKGEEREKMVIQMTHFLKPHYGSSLISKIDFSRNEIYLFETNSYPFDNVMDNFYSTLYLYKGILEYSYHRFKWKLDISGNMKNKKEFSCFKFPLFIYLKSTGYVNLLRHEDYPYDYVEHEENLKNKRNLKFFEETLKIFTEKKIDTGIEIIISDCFRLYGLGIDIPYIDQSFLFFWNVLEKITLSVGGNTEQVIKRIQDFFSKKFWNDSQNSINHLKNIRNKRVHKGTGDISILDLNLLKYLCDTCILSILGNPPGSEKNLKTTKHLEVFYTIKDNQHLKEIKEIIDYTIIKVKRH